jgi:5-methylcytosine-specific restriction protein A
MIERVLLEHPVARTERFAGHPLAQYVRGDAAQTVRDALGEIGEGLVVEGSAGAGNWAAVPWVGVFDPLVTDSATRGYYVVYLFSVRGEVCFLSLNQGTTETRTEFGAEARTVLADRAATMRSRITDFAKLLPAHEIDLRSGERLPGDYAAAHVLGFAYPRGAIPSEDVLRAEVQTPVRAYRALTFRGGIDPSLEQPNDPDADPSTFTSLEELRRYRMHRVSERNPKASRLAKKHHGYSCQACGFSFLKRYGTLGDGYIEAHHLRPISSLAEGVKVTYAVPTDFAVLCSNCHRMIHRTSDPSDLAGFRALVTCSSWGLLS